MGDDLSLISDVWNEHQQKRLAELLDMLPGIVSSTELEKYQDWLAQIEVIFSSWSMPELTPAQLSLMPRLKAVFYAAGSVKGFAAPLLERGITVASAWAANAIPVAEFTLSQILFSLKLGWQYLRQFRDKPGPHGWSPLPVPGVYDSTVGLISLGMVGRQVCEKLRPFRLRKLAFDPYASPACFSDTDTHQASLEDIFKTSDVVSLHAPWLPETEGMITGELLAMMKPNATFINTSRGALVNEPELIEVLRQRSDLTAILDVTWPEPPEIGSPIYSMENIVLTPHIAGSNGREVIRMSDLMIEEFMAWHQKRPLRYEWTPERLHSSA